MTDWVPLVSLAGPPEELLGREKARVSTALTQAAPWNPQGALKKTNAGISLLEIPI